jgi:DNA-binding CsgD family transcriptional regulator
VSVSADRVAAGREALGRAAWADARGHFEAALAEEETPEAFEGLGVAAWWLEDTAATIAARRRAYSLYRACGDAAGAARAATGLAIDFCLEGEEAVARGWMQRARRLLEDSEPAAEHGWCAVWEAHMALMADHDPVAAAEHSGRAVALGRAVGDVDLEMLGRAYQGFALVSLGRVDEGMRALDEATTAAMAGEISDIDATATACCCLIYACEFVRDYGRAAQWCERLKEFCERWSYQLMFSICRSHYAGVLIWRGKWADAERELDAAIAAFEETRPASAGEAIVRLAHLRVRQGRLEEAERLLERVDGGPKRLFGFTPATLVRSELALRRGDVDGALDWAERYLAAIGPDSGMERAAGLEALVAAHAARGAVEEARVAAEELRSLAERIGTDPLVAAAGLAQALVAEGPSQAKPLLDVAVSLYERSGAPFEAARARVELARCLAVLGRDAAARRELEAATTAFRELGAPLEAQRATAALALRPAGLSAREVEVVRLVARGLSNEEIAARLFLSVRTVERHLSNVYVKLGAEGKAARAALSAFAAKHGLV